MQGQRGIIGTLPETLDFDHGPAPANAIISQQIFWNSMRNPAEDRLTDFMHLNDAIANPVGQERQSLGGWNLGESSSSGGQIEVNCNEQKTEHVWSSPPISCMGNGQRLEDNVNLNHHIIRSHNPDVISQNLNLNTSFVDHGNDNFQVTEDHNAFKTSVMDNGRSSAAVPNPPLVPSRTNRLVLGDNDDRPGCSLDGRRPPCKRKAVEGNMGQSSVSGSSSFFQHPESSPWPSVPGRYDAGSSLSIPVASQSTMPRLGLGLRGGPSGSNFDSPVTVHPEGSHRNFRLRINPSNQESVPAALFSAGSAVRHSVVPHPHHSSRLLAIDRYELGSSPAVDTAGNQSQPSVIPVSVIPVPTLPQSGQQLCPLRWNESSSARTGSLLTPVSLADREDANPRSTTRNLLEHPSPLPVNDLRNLARSSISRNLAGGVSGVPGHVASSSRSGSSSGSHPLTAPSWVPPPNVSSRSSRRLAEYVRRSLFSSTIAESGAQGDLHTPLHLRPSASSASSSEEPSGASNAVQHRSHPRSAAWMDRQGEGILGIPYPLRTLTVGSEGRSRHVSEQIRNVLDLMRRGEGLRLEDVMILDQSVFFGVADIHDRHRDMRLDVDNMSYEELLALEERIGNVNTGLSEDTIMKSLKQREYSFALRSVMEAEPCCVCQEEYNDGENLGTLDCGHNFHTVCIKQWLMLKNWCPICKTTGLAAS